jgi:hypothetical protein
MVEGEMDMELAGPSPVQHKCPHNLLSWRSVKDQGERATGRTTGSASYEHQADAGGWMLL